MKPIRIHKGFTLIELVVVIAVLAIVLAIGMPSLSAFFDRTRVKRGADTVSAFLTNAKSEAIKRNKNVSAVVTGGGATWCVGMTESATCDCSTAGACQIDGVDRVISSTSFKGVNLNSPATDHAFVFTPQRGTVTGNGTVQLESADGLQMNVVVGTVGRIRLCSPNGGAPAC